MDNSQLAGFANTFRVRGSTIILYIYCKCLLQKFLALVNFVCTFAGTMIYARVPKSTLLLFSGMLTKLKDAK